ncbi:hypothetical protein [Streptomyces sp. NBC_00019]|uniref:hypothetical protein n=1 Tax=Streptomyces sp. NBC_00019 TaxID=2975623 RepID=UPI00324501AA
MDLSPEQEARRIAAVRRYDILDTPPDGAFDRIAALAARLFDAPAATVTIVDTDRVSRPHRAGEPGRRDARRRAAPRGLRLPSRSTPAHLTHHAATNRALGAAAIISDLTSLLDTFPAGPADEVALLALSATSATPATAPSGASGTAHTSLPSRAP